MCSVYPIYKLFFGSLLLLLVRAGSLRETTNLQLFPDLSHPIHPNHPSSSSSSSSSSVVAASVTSDDQLLPADHNPQRVPGFLESSQESGFYSEDSEENKPSQASVRSWDTREEDNNTSLYSESLTGYSLSSLHPNSSSLPAAPPSPSPSPSSSALLAESVDSDPWEMDSESSGVLSEPARSLSPTDATPAARSTVADASDHNGAPLGHRGEQAWGRHPETAAPDRAVPDEHQGGVEEEEEEARSLGREGGVPAQLPTVAEMGPVPTGAPLQPEVLEHDGMEEEEEEQVAQGKGEEEEEEMRLAPVRDSEEKEEDEEEEREGMDEEERAWMESRGRHHHTPLTTVPSSSVMPAVLFTQVPWQHLGPSDADGDHAPEEQESELSRGGTDYMTEADLLNAQLAQESVPVRCVDWSYLAGKGYVILNMTDNFDCDEFRAESGERLLEMLETAFSHKMNSPQGSWYISLSKPTRHDHQLLMTLASNQGVIATKDVLSMLGEIRRDLREIGIQNYSSVTTCHARPSQTRSDYGKLFVVLVIIGSVCVVIIASGLIYICWQRRLPKMKNMSRGEELHFVENGCHDNPTLDVTSDSQSELQEKKSSANGVPVGVGVGVDGGGGGGGGGGSGGWQILVNKPGKEEVDNMEEDTHL